jgi:hypothetical protein
VISGREEGTNGRLWVARAIAYAIARRYPTAIQVAMASFSLPGSGCPEGEMDPPVSLKIAKTVNWKKNGEIQAFFILAFATKPALSM